MPSVRRSGLPSLVAALPRSRRGSSTNRSAIISIACSSSSSSHSRAVRAAVFDRVLAQRAVDVAPRRPSPSGTAARARSGCRGRPRSGPPSRPSHRPAGRSRRRSTGTPTAPRGRRSSCAGSARERAERAERPEPERIAAELIQEGRDQARPAHAPNLPMRAGRKRQAVPLLATVRAPIRTSAPSRARAGRADARSSASAAARACRRAAAASRAQRRGAPRAPARTCASRRARRAARRA